MSSLSCLVQRKSKLFCVALLFLSHGALAQTRMVLNGAKVNIAQGAYLVIDNPASNAITRTSGHIISEGANNRIQWHIGTTTGTYTIPWGYGSADYLPVTFTKNAGTGSGLFIFSTYHTAWQNSAELPSGITNFNRASGIDNSGLALDRFWQISAQNYTVKPTLSNLVMTYLEGEHTAANNSISENALFTQGWDNTLGTWSNYAPSISVDVSGNKLTVLSVDPSHLYPWWALTNIVDRHWIGAGSTAWNNPGNWSVVESGPAGAAIPSTENEIYFDGSADVDCVINDDITLKYIKTDAGYSGTITNSGSVNVNGPLDFSGGTFAGGTKSITVAGHFTLSGGSFTSTTSTLDIKRNFNITGGTFLNNSGTVRFSGSDGQTQTITSPSPTDFKNIVVTNTSANPAVSVQSNQNLHGILTLSSNSVFDADGSANSSVFKLISTSDSPTQDAAIAPLPAGASVSGNVTIQRFMSIEGAGNGRIYRYISSPIQNATVADIQNEIKVTGSFTGTSICSGCGSGQSMFAYNESITTDISRNGIADYNDGYVDFPANSNTETMTPGKGYAIYIRGNTMASALWDVRGSINKGNLTPVSFPITYTSSGIDANDGWNLVGNPFPSTIDWNAASGWTKTNLNTSIYTTDNGGGSTQYATWNGVAGTNGGSRYIAIGQAFWVKSSVAGSPALQADENVKSPEVQSTFFREKAIDNLLRITLVKGTTRDEAIIHFRTDATTGFDKDADALKLKNSIVNLSILQQDGINLAINSLPQFNCDASVRLNIENVVAGDYRLDLSGLGSFVDNVAITLSDSLTGSNINVRNQSAYDFSITSNPLSSGANRFRVKFSTSLPDSLYQLTAPDICDGAAASIQVSNTQQDAVYFALVGPDAVSPAITGNDDTLTLKVPGSNLVSGLNTITIRANIPGCSAISEKNITFNVEKKYNVEVGESEKVCREGTVTLQVSGAPADGTYNWYDTESSLAPLATHGAQFTTPPSMKSKSYFVSIANHLGCEGPRQLVLAEIVHYEDALITEFEGLLHSNYTDGNQWYFGENIMEGETGQSIRPALSGSYQLQVNIEGCFSSTAKQVTISENESVITAVETPGAPVISVYPNPTTDAVSIEIPVEFGAIRDARIINTTGVVLGNFDLQKSGKKYKSTFLMKSYPSGVYIIQIAGKSGIEEVKLIKR